jgi:Alanine-zipper, major outer membrane lipoprotein
MTPGINLTNWGLQNHMRTTMATCRSMRLGVALLVGLTGCTDLAPLQARLDDLQSRMDRLETESANAAATTTAAQVASAKADDTAIQAMDAAKVNTNAIGSLEDEIDRMFKRTPSK